jgi:hypothetical protein
MDKIEKQIEGEKLHLDGIRTAIAEKNEELGKVREKGRKGVLEKDVKDLMDKQENRERKLNELEKRLEEEMLKEEEAEEMEMQKDREQLLMSKLQKSEAEKGEMEKMMFEMRQRLDNMEKEMSKDKEDKKKEKEEGQSKKSSSKSSSSSYFLSDEEKEEENEEERDTIKAMQMSQGRMGEDEKKSNYLINMSQFNNYFKLDCLTDVLATDMVDFGMMNSTSYRRKFFELTKDLDGQERLMVVYLATGVKSKRRILEAIGRFKDEKWYQGVRKFFMNCVQYTSEVKGTGKMAVVHIPSCLPNIAAICFIKMGRAVSVKSFLENLWAAQLNLSAELKEEQKIWEKDFWNNQVKKGSSSYKQGFQEEFWLNKSSDKYSLLDQELREVVGEMGREELRAYINSWR